MNYAAKLNILISKDMEDNLRQIVANRVSILMKESNVFDAIFCFDYKADIAKLCDVAFQGVFDANSKVNSVGAEFTSSQLIIHVK